ncbi:LysM peptidoglycan-binding domain-containing protein [Brevibacillus daliensis]|uniref:LysM peptidoglycan-binding domain-containing protein n=1 Tax=Brevibacillus daliensis TaxID=2892995 RepID=UPI001E4FE4DC|nr:LysM peptidoglycan-binding domain-containing protein [Brevibacillus daliensis]
MWSHSFDLFPYAVQPGDSYWRLAQEYGISVDHIVAANPGVDPYQLMIGQTIYIPIARHNMPNNPAPSSECICMAEVQLSNQMRMLWEQHVYWARMLIISIAANLPDEQFVTKRLLRNPPDIANLIKPYYGEKNAAIFNQLFTEHLVIGAELVKAVKAGDSNAAARIEKRWYKNADDIAAFLSSINPNWPMRDLQKMLYEHLGLTEQEAGYRIHNDFASDIATFDKIEQQALMMADALTAGIVKQFPTLFAC